jgi:hypothetical protein
MDGKPFYLAVMSAALRLVQKEAGDAGSGDVESAAG